MSKQSDLVNIAQGDTITVDHANGRVGIGTSSPNEPLHVIGTVRSETSSTGDFNFYATSTGGGAYRIYPDDATTANPTWLHQSNSSEDQAWVIGGVERMRIDSAGPVTMPYQPSFVAVDNRGIGGVSAASLNISQYFNTVLTNIGGHYNSSNGRFTAPVSGTYLFGWNFFTQSPSSNASRTGIILNGSTTVFSGGETIALTQQGSLSIYLAANDYVNLGTQGGAYTAFWYSGGFHSRFWGFLVG